MSAGAAITASSNQAITASSSQGITASSAQGITASSALGITASSGRGITASSAQGITASSVLANGGQLVAMGPVDHINLNLNTVEVLGQTVAISGLSNANLTPGMMVSVFGHVLGEGFIAGSAIVSSDEQYIPGATPVFVSGYASGIESDLGRVQIGNLEVDHNAISNMGSFSGDVLSFFGVQPALGGLFLAE